jgi:hypothetical protein
MGQFYIVLPQGIENLHKNPSAEINATGYTASGTAASVARSSEESFRGAFCIKCMTGSTNAGGCYYGTVQLTSGEDYTFSAYVKGQADETYKIYIADTSGNALATDTFVGTGEWQRVSVSYTETSTASRRFYITKNAGSTSSTALYIDACQIENLPYETTYCDGDQEGCKWHGGPAGAHISASSRSGMSRAGGRKVDLDSYSAYLVSQQGTGMPTIKNNSVAYGNGPGSFWKGQQATERAFTLAFSVAGNSVADLHQKRLALIDAIKPDLVYPQQEFILGYTSGGEDIEIRCHYDSGFEIADGKYEIETLPIKVIASDPYWYKVQEHKGFIDEPSRGLSSTTYAMFRDANGDWSVPGGTGPTGGAVNVVKHGPDGCWYFGGAFTSCGGVANTASFAKYDPVSDTFSSMGTFAGGAVNDIAFDHLGYVIAVGAFTTVNGNAWPYVVKHNGSSFQRLGSQTPNAAAVGVVVANNNKHFIVGNFTGGGWGAGATGGAIFVPDMTVNDGFTGSWGNWSSFNANPWGVVLRPSGDEVLIYGTFTTMGGVARPGLVSYNTNTTEMTSFGQPTGTTGGALATKVSADNATVYAIYRSTTTVPAGYTNVGNTFHYILAHSGSGWVRLGTADGYLDYMHIDPENDDLFVSSFRATSPVTTSPPRTIDDIFTFHSAVYSGNRWSRMPTMAVWSGVAFDGRNNMVMWFSAFGSNSGGFDNYSVHTTVTNEGSAEVQPNIVVTGYGRFLFAKNWTTGATLWGSLSHYQYDGERTVINTALGSVSSNRRKVWADYLMPNSDVGGFFLVPGDNEIEFFFQYTPGNWEEANIDVWFNWREKHWSIDGGVPSA